MRPGPVLRIFAYFRGAVGPVKVRDHRIAPGKEKWSPTAQGRVGWTRRPGDSKATRESA
ncbi:hypothetical protein GCM10027456_17030 [Kineosporia babensis]